jgi:hypothetical protein
MRDPLAKRREMFQSQTTLESKAKQKATKQYIGLVTEEQFEFVRLFAFQCRSPKINKSSILRAFIRLLQEMKFDCEKIHEEEDS